MRCSPLWKGKLCLQHLPFEKSITNSVITLQSEKHFYRRSISINSNNSSSDYNNKYNELQCKFTVSPLFTCFRSFATSLSTLTTGQQHHCYEEQSNSLVQRHGVGFDIAAFVASQQQQQQQEEYSKETQRELLEQTLEEEVNKELVSNNNNDNINNNNNNNKELLVKEDVKVKINKIARLRGRVSHTRIRGKLSFIELRQPPFHSIQIVCNSPLLTKQVKQLNVESVIEVTGSIVKTQSPITSTTCKTHEIHAIEINIISHAATPLPFPLNDTNTKLETRLNYRSVDLRTRGNIAMVYILSTLSNSFRNAFVDRHFVEIHTPKLIASSSEGGSAVFSVNYSRENNCNNSNHNNITGSTGTKVVNADKKMKSNESKLSVTQHIINDDTNYSISLDKSKLAYLAQSPQLYKQMMINGDAMRVFEIGPVFRAENSFTHRHLTEFTGVDFEMVIEHSYLEILNVLESLICSVLYSIQRPENIQLLLSPAFAGLNKNKFISSMENSVNSENNNNYTDDFRPIQCEVSEVIIEKMGVILERELPLHNRENQWTDATCTVILQNETMESETYTGDEYQARVRCERCKESNNDSNNNNNNNNNRDTNCCINQAAPRVLRMSFVNAKKLLADNNSNNITTTSSPSSPLVANSDAIIEEGEEAKAKVDDFTLCEERELGRLIKKRYGVDLYVIDQFPLSARPFYTMPLVYNDTTSNNINHNNNYVNNKRYSSVDTISSSNNTTQYSCSFDMYLRGEEICSGAQRQHNASLLQAAIEERGLTHELNLQHYIDSFKYGVWPHGGAGLGLERIALFLLDAYDIRQVSLFPRDPKRLTPETR